ncbi:hypothetical protein ES705_44558 [subsurface metagenome]
MNEENHKEKLFSAKIREKRYQWIIATVIPTACLIIGFLGGMLFQSFTLRDQVIINMTEIQILKESLGKIETKLDKVLNDRR